MFGFVALACHGPCHPNSPSAARHGPTLPEEMERVWSEGFDRRKEKSWKKRKQFLQISIQSLVYSLVDIQRGLQNGEWNPEELERNKQILQDAADDALFYCDYFSRLLAIDGWRRRDVNH